jgi:hypothetical protein
MDTFEQLNQFLLESNYNAINYEDYIIKANNDKYDLSTFNIISTFIIEKKWLPCYFLYTYEILSGNYDIDKITSYLIGKSKKIIFKYEINDDYIIIENLDEIRKYDNYKNIQLSTSSNLNLIIPLGGG